MNQDENQKCPVCDGPAAPPFLRRKGVPAHQNLLLADRDAATSIARGDLVMTGCPSCGFVHNQAFDPSLLNYGESYDNAQSCSPAFSEHLTGLARRIVRAESEGLRRVVEVGCGKGEFLRQVVGLGGTGWSGTGFDPSYVGPEERPKDRVTFRREFYGPGSANLQADIVVCRHVVEHVPDPLVLLTAVRQALRGSPTAKVYFETPCVEWILKNEVIWDFFYEHCSLFTAASLATAFQSSGFDVTDIGHVFGGQYLWIEAVPAADQTEIILSPGAMPDLAARFGPAETTLLASWLEFVANLSKRHAVALWGAGAKGVTLANLIDPERSKIDSVVDINPRKQGRFLPGTGHPIIGPPGLLDRGVTAVILMNPNYEVEVRASIDAISPTVELVAPPHRL